MIGFALKALGLGGVSKYMLIGAGVLIAGLAASVAFLIDDTLHQRKLSAANKAIYEANIATVEEANRSLVETLAEQRVALEEQRAMNEALQETRSTIRGELSRFRRELSRARSKIDEAAISKPSIVERRVNDATRRMFKSFEGATGGDENSTSGAASDTAPPTTATSAKPPGS